VTEKIYFSEKIAPNCRRRLPWQQTRAFKNKCFMGINWLKKKESIISKAMEGQVIKTAAAQIPN
jgi:hypothetical protein